MSVTAPDGFVAGGTACGIKASGALDLALVATSDGRAVPAAGVFTVNLAPAAPVLVSRAHLAASGGRAAGVVINAGNANAATGVVGRANAERTATLVASALGTAPEHVLVCSTGIIGVPLPMERLDAALPSLATGLTTDEVGATAAATAIMTTDTSVKQTRVEGNGFLVGGMGKGAAMLAPDMATMLAVLTTDVLVDPDVLAPMLREAVARSFNAVSIDGCTSTNDAVLVLASGSAGPVDDAAVSEALHEACADLASQMVADAEGATRVVQIAVSGAADDADARRAARRVADSALVKCSMYGGDPYWGRVVSELGSAGVSFDPERVSISYGGETTCRKGVAAAHDEAAVRSHLAGRHVELHADLGLGSGAAVILTADLGPGYIDENMRTS
ncbi:MAG TPA: bifunctional glutamate N-acetyltransferase/amino-acid acetyltransferase ArgJ [Acidimicrobiales bacterium]